MNLSSQEAFCALFDVVKVEARELLSTRDGAVWVLKAYLKGWISKPDIMQYILDRNVFSAFILQVEAANQEEYFALYNLAKEEADHQLLTDEGAIWVLKAYQKGWTPKSEALHYARDGDAYFRVIETDDFKAEYLHKFPNKARALSYYANRPVCGDELRKSVPAADLDAVMIELGGHFDEVYKRMKAEKDFHLMFKPEYATRVVQELIFSRGCLDLADFAAHYLAHFDNDTSRKLAIILKPEAHLHDLDAIMAFKLAFPYPLPASIIACAIPIMGDDVLKLHELYRLFGGIQGEEDLYLTHLTNPKLKFYKPPQDKGLYIRFYKEVILHLLSALRHPDYYEYILNQIMTILPDLNEADLDAIMEKWLHVAHTDRDTYINHYTTYLSRIEKGIDKSKALKQKLSFIAGTVHDKRASMERFRSALSLFESGSTFALHHTLFMITNAPLHIRNGLSIDYCKTLYDRSFEAFRTQDPKIMESLVYAIFGRIDDNGSAILFRGDKPELTKRCLVLLSHIDTHCRQTSITQDTMNLLFCGIRLMQNLREYKLIAPDDDLIYRSQCEQFIYTSIPYLPQSVTDIRGALNVIYKGTSLERLFRYETASYLERYCAVV